MEIAKYSSFVPSDAEHQNIQCVTKGKNSIAVLAVGYNEPKGQETLATKVTRVLVEHYMRRPSLKEEALQKITEFAHDAICVQQAPGYQAECAMGVLMAQGDQFRWITTGDTRIFHFVNGQVMESNSGTSPRLGNGREKEMPEVLPATEFKKGENSFLLCSASFTKYVREDEIENALSLSESPEEWLRTLRNLYEDRSQGEPYALLTVFMPEKRKRLSKKAVIAIIVALVVLVVGGFLALGAMRRKNGPQGPGGPGTEPTRPPMEQSGPGAEPTRPPKPERPPEGQEGQEPGEEPTQPPQPTQPPEPDAPEQPQEPGDGGAL